MHDPVLCWVSASRQHSVSEVVLVTEKDLLDQDAVEASHFLH
jgi:hypothetical protein